MEPLVFIIIITYLFRFWRLNYLLLIIIWIPQRPQIYFFLWIQFEYQVWIFAHCLMQSGFQSHEAAQ